MSKKLKVKQPEATQPAAPDPTPNLPECPVVGIGASAGGLAAFEAFFSGMPGNTDPGMAFVLVQHLAPDHKSILSELVRRYTRMEVFQVEDGMTVRPNCTYIIPPSKDMAFVNGTLQLLEPTAPRGQRLPIDFFFRSLALDQHQRAIGIVLSGTGSDGAQGLRAIKAEGGMAMAQNPASTEFEGMPASAIATGLVDFILPPAEMPAQLIAYVSHAFGKIPRPIPALSPNADGSLKKIFVLLRSQTGHDFSYYKRSTFARRVERRMAVHQIQSLDEYVRYLQQTPSDVEALFRDLLIGVTEFFRDPEAFDALRREGIPRVFAGKAPGATVRVWAPGCSTGEEAYSLTILLQEHIDKLGQNFKVQVFGTDIDQHAIECARAGVYPGSVAENISAERLGRFFSREADGSYRILKSIRDKLIFSEQSMIKDPPFSKLDLISCRNVLIYMDAELQKKLIPLFHYALRTGGVLFLGTSETVGDFGDLFSTLDRKSKLYERKQTPAHAHFVGFGPLPTEDRVAVGAAAKLVADGKLPVREITERTLLHQCAPPSALVDEAGHIFYLHGRTGKYLEPAPGDAELNILKMAREGLRRDLTTALHKAATLRDVVRHPGLRVKTNGDFTTIDLTIRPVAASAEMKTAPRLFLVIFDESAGQEQHEKPTTPDPIGKLVTDDRTFDARIELLREQLRDQEEYLHAANEELATSNEELKSSNEEMQSMNEELQSTNEELDTSKEELQSINEELSTVNGELQNKVADLSRSNNDMNNLLSGTGIGTIFVDHQMRIQRFTPSVTQLVNLIQSDVGRPIGHIVANLIGYDNLVADVQEVLDHLVPKSVEVHTKGGAWYMLRIRPYRTQENVIEGAVITFAEITETKNARLALQESEGLRRLAVVVRDAHDAITVLDLQGMILAWNPGAVRMYGWTEAEALVMNIRDLLPDDRKKDVLSQLRRQSQPDVVEPFQTSRIAKDGKVVEIFLTATALVNEAGSVYAIATTERKAPSGGGGVA